MTNSDIAGAGFTVTGADPSAINFANLCGTYYMVGGSGVLSSGSIAKSYIGLPAHYKARVTFFFMKIDAWNNNKVMVTANTIDVSPSPSITFNSSTDSSIMKLCGTTASTEAFRPVDIYFDHNLSNLDLLITTDLPFSTSASWGIWDLSVYINICNLAYCTSCNGPDVFNCLSCVDGTFLQTSPGPSTCESICPDGFFSQSSTNTCPQCDTSCKTCSGPLSTNCLTCLDGTFLLVNGASFTCTQCPAGYWPDTSNNLCSSCDQNCKTCTDGSPFGCASCDPSKYFFDKICYSRCPIGYYGVNDTMTCNNTCPNSTFAYDGSNTCCPCNNCDKCNGFQINECTVCSSNQYLEEGKCVSTCSPDHFINIGNLSCDSKIYLFYNDFFSYKKFN